MRGAELTGVQAGQVVGMYEIGDYSSTQEPQLVQNPTPMKTLLLLLILLSSFAICPAAEEKTRELFALHPVTKENTSEATPYTYYGAVDQKPHSGHLKKSAILTLSDVESVKRDTTEIASAPFPGLAFRLSDNGLLKLQRYLEKPQSAELVVIIDGHPYAAVDIIFMRQLVKARDPLLIIFPGPYEQTTAHLLELLVEKLGAALKSTGSSPPASGDSAPKPTIK